MAYLRSHKGSVFNRHIDDVLAGAFLPTEEVLNFSDAVELTGMAIEKLLQGLNLEVRINTYHR